ncbi:MAG TPA: TonB family protein [Candidatus Binatia bacterium]|nr:TonB family protein [Candidatus Binatia bacterium]
MSTPIGLWKQWEGKVVAEKFQLRQWLGGSDHSAVFLTENAAGQKAAIKLIADDGPESLNRLSAARTLAHPHLIRLFDCGRGEIDSTAFLYMVMEFAEENLSEILPVRALSAEEAKQTLRPAVEALGFLHKSGFVHGHIKPANILAVDNQLKISSDGIARSGERGFAWRSPYDAPETASSGASSAGDIWSLGATLLAVLTQKEPSASSRQEVPRTIPEPLRGIVQECLLNNAAERCTADGVLSRLSPPMPSAAVKVDQTTARASNSATEADATRPNVRRWIFISIVVAVIAVSLLAAKFIGHRPAVPAPGGQQVNEAPATPAAQSPAPFAVQKGLVKGGVQHQEPPDVSRSALNTISGRIKIKVQVSVDANGDVTTARITTSGSSQYFAGRALLAAKKWKFNPPQQDGNPVASEWSLRFEFGRRSTQASGVEMRP